MPELVWVNLQFSLLVPCDVSLHTGARQSACGRPDRTQLNLELATLYNGELSKSCPTPGN